MPVAPNACNTHLWTGRYAALRDVRYLTHAHTRAPPARLLALLQHLPPCDIMGSAHCAALPVVLPIFIPLTFVRTTSLTLSPSGRTLLVLTRVAVPPRTARLFPSTLAANLRSGQFDIPTDSSPDVCLRLHYGTRCPDAYSNVLQPLSTNVIGFCVAALLRIRVG